MTATAQASSNTWTVRGGRKFTPNPYALMGIINVTPDSFSDGGQFIQAEKALAHAKTLVAEGAQILDVGAESSRPGAQPLTAQEELQRLLPVLTSLFAQTWVGTAAEGQESAAPLVSVDTYHAETARAVLELGAECINDISACAFEPELLEVIAEYKPGYVLMHSTARPEIMQECISTDNILDVVQRFFEKELSRLTAAGLPEENILLDVGIGFGKSLEQNLELMRNMHIFKQFGRPILAAISMKSFLHGYLALDAKDMETRAEATAIATALLGMRGICYHRVHHVQKCARALGLTKMMQ